MVRTRAFNVAPLDTLLHRTKNNVLISNYSTIINRTNLNNNTLTNGYKYSKQKSFSNSQTLKFIKRKIFISRNYRKNLDSSTQDTLRGTSSYFPTSSDIHSYDSSIFVDKYTIPLLDLNLQDPVSNISESLTKLDNVKSLFADRAEDISLWLKTNKYCYLKDIDESIVQLLKEADRYSSIHGLLLADVPVEDLKNHIFSSKALSNLFSPQFIRKQKKKLYKDNVLPLLSTHQVDNNFEDDISNNPDESILNFKRQQLIEKISFSEALESAKVEASNLLDFKHPSELSSLSNVCTQWIQDISLFIKKDREKGGKFVIPLKLEEELLATTTVRVVLQSMCFPCYTFDSKGNKGGMIKKRIQQTTSNQILISHLAIKLGDEIGKLYNEMNTNNSENNGNNRINTNVNNKNWNSIISSNGNNNTNENNNDINNNNTNNTIKGNVKTHDNGLQNKENQEEFIEIKSTNNRNNGNEDNKDNNTNNNKVVVKSNLNLVMEPIETEVTIYKNWNTSQSAAVGGYLLNALIKSCKVELDLQTALKQYLSNYSQYITQINNNNITNTNNDNKNKNKKYRSGSLINKNSNKENLSNASSCISSSNENENSKQNKESITNINSTSSINILENTDNNNKFGKELLRGDEKALLRTGRDDKYLILNRNLNQGLKDGKMEMIMKFLSVIKKSRFNESLVEVEAFRHVLLRQGVKTFGVLEMRESCMLQLRDFVAKSLVSLVALPMVCKPKKWTNVTSGGSLLLRHNFIRGSKLNEIKVYNLEEVFDTVNKFSQVPWIINGDMLEMIKSISSANNDIPIKQHLPIPSSCHSVVNTLTSISGINSINGIDSDVVRSAGLNSNDLSELSLFLRRIKIAESFVNEKKLYMPLNIDFRGRMYPLSPYLNHMNDDMCRSLLLFAEKRKLGDKGLYWMKIHVSNMYGNDKISFKERIKWVDEHIDIIKELVKKPFGDFGQNFWCKADKPLQFYSSCLELIRAIETNNPSEYMTRLPIQQDGTCNGLQHYAALGLDELGARYVNLVNSEEPQDLYTHILQLVIQKVYQDLNMGLLSQGSGISIISSSIRNNNPNDINKEGVTNINISNTNTIDMLENTHNNNISNNNKGKDNNKYNNISNNRNNGNEDNNDNNTNNNKVESRNQNNITNINNNNTNNTTNSIINNNIIIYRTNKNTKKQNKNINENNKKYAEICVNNNLLSRKVIKQTVMTICYGVTRIGAIDQVHSKLKDIKKIEHLPENEMRGLAGYLAHKILSSISTVFSEAMGIKNWLDEISLAHNKYNVPVTWVSPVGLPCEQPYCLSVTRTVRTPLQAINISKYVSSVDKRKQKLGFPPNYIHSLDASHLMLTARKIFNHTNSFAAVHDSFWVHPDKVDMMHKYIREEFVNMHKGPVLEDLHKSVINKLQINFRPPPPKGKLNLEQVLDSTYFFH